MALRQRGGGAVDEHDGGKPVQPDELDEPADVRPGTVDVHAALALAQPPRDHREVEHERRVGEPQGGEVDHEVAAGADRSRQRGSAQRDGGAILVAGYAQSGWVVGEGDDAAP